MIVGGVIIRRSQYFLFLCVPRVDSCVSDTVVLSMVCRGKLGKKFGEAHAWPLFGVVRDSNPSKLLYS